MYNTIIGRTFIGSMTLSVPKIGEGVEENGHVERHELRDVSTGVMSRSTRSCFTTTATTNENVNNVSTMSSANGGNYDANAVTNVSVPVTTINGNLAPPPQRV